MLTLPPFNKYLVPLRNGLKSGVKASNQRNGLCLPPPPLPQADPAVFDGSGASSAHNPGTLFHETFKTTIQIDVEVHGSCALGSDGTSRYRHVLHVLTSEGLDLVGLLPSEATAAIEDELEAAAYLSGRAISLGGRASVEPQARPSGGRD